MQNSSIPKRYAVPVSFILGSVVLSLLAAEGTVRAFGHQPYQVTVNPHAAGNSWVKPDPEIGWVNRSGSYPSIEPGHALMSFRDDGSRADPAGSKADASKIVAVGCSFTQGLGIVDGETYAHVLNKSLPNFEVVNHGVGGYSTYQSFLSLKRYFALSRNNRDTSLVIYGLYGDHLGRNVALPHWVTWATLSDGRRFVPPNARMDHGRLIVKPWGPIDPWPLETKSALVALAHRAAIHVKHSASLSEQEEVLKEIVRRMVEATDNNGARFVVAGLAKVPPWFADWARNNRVDFVDCQHPDFGRDSALQVGGVGHPNRVLHEWWGRCLSRMLIHSHGNDPP